MGVFFSGTYHGLQESNYDDVHERIKSWSDWARRTHSFIAKGA